MCDSRESYNEGRHTTSHGVENVVTTFAPNRLKTWWQSENGEFISTVIDQNFFFPLLLSYSLFMMAAIVPNIREFLLLSTKERAFVLMGKRDTAKEGLLKETPLRITPCNHTIGGSYSFKAGT